MKLNRLVFFICFIFQLSNCLFGQFDVNFIKYLSENNLKNEHLTYLLSNKNDLKIDSFFYFKSKYYVQYRDDSLFFDAYSKSIDLCNSDTFLINIASINYLKSTNEYKDRWFKLLDKKEISTISNFSNRMYLLTQKPSINDLSTVPEELVDDFKKCYKSSKKIPLIAASLSALIPGAGQLYIGNVKSFTARITTQTLLAFQFIESNKKLGLYHPISILNASFFSVFYFVNIVGSYRDTKEKKEEFKNQFLINASNYLCNRIDSPLY